MTSYRHDEVIKNKRKRSFDSTISQKSKADGCCSSWVWWTSLTSVGLSPHLVGELLAFLLGHKPHNFYYSQRVRRIQNYQISFVRSGLSGSFDPHEPQIEVKKGLKFRSRASWMKFYSWLAQLSRTIKIENLTKKSGFLTKSYKTLNLEVSCFLEYYTLMMCDNESILTHRHRQAWTV